MSATPTFFCVNPRCGKEIGSVDTQYCPHCGMERWEFRGEQQVVPPSPSVGHTVPPNTMPRSATQKGHPGIGATIGSVVGLLVGLVAVRLINQAMCPHSILGPCHYLTGTGIKEVVVLAVFVGLVIGATAGAAVKR